MKRMILVLLAIIMLNFVIIFQNTCNSHAKLDLASPDIEWHVKKGDKFTWVVKKSSSSTFNFLPKDSTYELEITSIDTTASNSTINGKLIKYNADDDIKTTILNSELFLQYNHTPNGAKFYTAFLDQCFIAPKAFADYIDEIENFYYDELGFSTSGMQYSGDKLDFFYINNLSNSLILSWDFNDNHVAELLEVTEYGETTYLLKLETEGKEEPEDFLWIILLVVVIVAALGAAGMFIFIRKRSVNKKVLAFRKKVAISKDTKLGAGTTVAKDIRPKKDKKSDELKESTELSEVEQEEIEKTESEMDIEKQELMCVVHRGPIIGTMYACTKCQTIYCQKCAKTLKDKGEKCWSCHQEFEL